MLIWSFSFFFVRIFHGKNSTCVQYDDEGTPHDFLQGEGGEQGNPLMPALCALGQHAVLTEVQATLRDGKMLFAYLVLQRFSSRSSNRSSGQLASKSILGVAPRRGQVRAQKRIEGRWCWDVGHRAFVQKWQADKGQSHSQFLSRIPGPRQPVAGVPF